MSKVISFSALKDFIECPYRHYLKYIKKVPTEPNHHMEFGKIMHDACETYIKTGEIDLETAQKKITTIWKKHKFEDLDTFLVGAKLVLEDLPVFLDLTFPGWEPVSTEEKINETVPTRKDLKFKGFLDCIIKVGNTYWILDWKFSKVPWKRWKREEEILKYQLIYYREFWRAKKKKKNVRIGFVPFAYDPDFDGPRGELIEVQPTKERRQGALNVLNETIDRIQSGEKRKIRKNKWGSNCKYCSYFQKECK